MTKSPIILSVLITALLLGGGLYLSYEPELGGTSITDLTDKYNQATEIKAKYQLDGATLKTTPKDDPKDRIEVWIGEKTDTSVLGAETNLEPKLTIARWDSEVEFSIKPKDYDLVALKDKTFRFDKEKTIFETPKVDYKFYSYTDGEKGGYKMVWFLKEKPIDTSNFKLEFDIQSKGLDFFYQPELTQQEIDDGAFRPDNIIGSYAIYMKNPGTNWVDGKLYRAGKFGQMYKPHLIDANGLEEWGILHIENGIYSVGIPQEFLDKAVYPIKSNDTFGYTGEGGTHKSTAADDSYGSFFTGAVA